MEFVRLKEYAKTLPDAGLTLAYIQCVESGYTQDKEIADMYGQHARERLLFDYKVHNREDILRVFDDTFPDWENNPDLIEERKKWEEYPWQMFRQALNEMGKWCDFDGYYFVKNYEY